MKYGLYITKTALIENKKVCRQEPKFVICDRLLYPSIELHTGQ